MARLKSLLYPGETVLLRLERPFWDIAVRVAAPFVVAVLLFEIMVRDFKYIERWVVSLGITGLAISLIALLLVMAFWHLLWATPFDWLLRKRRPDHWRIAVTDQRVMVRRGSLGGRLDEMMRHDIETCLYDRAEGKILLAGAGRELAIPCNQRQAGRILAALGYDAAGA